MRTLSVIGAPSSAGAYAPGQETAPQALRDAGLVDALREAGLAVVDRGDVAGFRWRPDRTRPDAQNVGPVVATARAVAKQVAAARAGGDVALVLGGDCTVGLGTIAGVEDPAGVLYFDLHADLNTPRSVPDGALDWMGLAHGLAEADAVPELVGLGPRAPLVAPADLLLFGFRPDQATDHERAAIERLALDVVELPEVDESPQAAAERALERLEARRERFVVHLDVDVIDFTDAPLSENTARNIGLSLDKAFDALTVFLSSERLAALTITELNPLHGEPSTLETFAARLVDAIRR